MKLLVALDAQVRAGEQIESQRRQKARQQFQRRRPVIADLDAVIRADCPEPLLEIVQYVAAIRGAWFLRRVEAEDDLAAARGGHLTDTIRACPVFGMKTDHGRVAAVYRGDHGPRSSKSIPRSITIFPNNQAAAAPSC